MRSWIEIGEITVPDPHNNGAPLRGMLVVFHAGGHVDTLIDGGHIGAENYESILDEMESPDWSKRQREERTEYTEYLGELPEDERAQIADWLEEATAVKIAALTAYRSKQLDR